MNIYLIAEKLSHSFSPLIHSKFGLYNYELKELKPDELKNYITSKNFDGLNVTIPYKIDVMPYLDNLSDDAKMIGSVNTITNRNGILTGYNTDLYGFLYLLNRNNIDLCDKKVLIIGNGGASKTVQIAAKTSNAKEIIVVGRKDNNQEFLSGHYDSDIIINTSPVGMYPNTGISPIDINNFKKCIAAVDLIYNPSKTQFLLDASKMGIKSVNGLLMLVAQAKRACEIFTDQTMPDYIIDKITTELELSTKNIVLIGMPGSGKTTIGKILAKTLDRPFIDTDDEIEKTGVNISDMITNQGELVFRQTEHSVAASVLNRSGTVISTGGGIVTYEPNIDLLTQNSIIFFINRNIELLATNGRPLSKGGIEKLIELYNQRIDKYKSVCDYEVTNDLLPADTANKILDILRNEENK